VVGVVSAVGETALWAEEHRAEMAEDPERRATLDEVTRYRGFTWDSDQWREYEPVESFTHAEFEWLEGRAEEDAWGWASPGAEAYLRRRAPAVIEAIKVWVHGVPSWQQAFVRFTEHVGGRIAYNLAGMLGKAVSYLRLGAVRPLGPPVIEDLLQEGQVVMIAGEEGAGKSTLAHEIAHGLLDDKVLGEFGTSDKVERVLIIDVEQSEDDADIIRKDLVERGVPLSPEVFWLDAVGRSFDNEQDKAWLREQVRVVLPQVIILDTATEAASKPREDESVKHLYILFGNFMRNDGVLGAVFLGQPRKRSQEAEGERRFDDLFGSRVWKGRSSAVFWVADGSFTVWKQRGSRLEKRWGARKGRLVRTERGTLLLGPMSQDERRSRILKAVEEHPGEFSKTSLIESHFRITGDVERGLWRRDLDAILQQGGLTQEGQYHRLKAIPRA